MPFDRVADVYDETRALSAEAEREVTDLLRSELRGREPCLEIGVGTGRIALPLARSRVAMAGVDLSRPMLERLVAKAGGRPFPLALADATALPFPDATFGSGLVAHVLHLIPEWTMALAELMRVIRPGGLLLVLQGQRPAVLAEIEGRFEEEAGLDVAFPGLDHDTRELDGEMTRLGAGVRALPPVADRRRVSPSEFIEQLERAVFSWTWRIDEATRRRAGARVRDWAAARFGSLETPQEAEAPIAWRAYDLP